MEKYITPDMKEYELIMRNALLAGSSDDEPGYGGEGNPDDDDDAPA